MPFPAPPADIQAAAPLMRDWRRDFHRRPELGYQEKRTSARVAELLTAFGCDHIERGLGQTGVVGVIHGRGGPAKNESEAVMLRADMDALPIVEETGAPYASEHPGVMHACGHDGHTAMLLGAAKVLAARRSFKGTVYCAFQPAEEGGAGAAAMIRDGLFQKFPARAVFGMHNWPGAPLGSFFTRVGPILASADEFHIRIMGRGGHAAQPNLTRDPIAALGALITALQTIVSRRIDPVQPVVVSITRVQGGSAFNVIPELVEIGGTVRAFDTDAHELAWVEMRRICAGVAAAFDVEITVKGADNAYPPTVNDAAQTRFAVEVAREVGAFANGESPPSMGGEDFAFLARERPGCFMLLGTGQGAPLHHPAYDFNDEAAPLGAAYWVRLAERALPL